jgi:hypothetical protein
MPEKWLLNQETDPGALKGIEESKKVDLLIDILSARSIGQTEGGEVSTALEKYLKTIPAEWNAAIGSANVQGIVSSYLNEVAKAGGPFTQREAQSVDEEILGRLQTRYDAKAKLAGAPKRKAA